MGREGMITESGAMTIHLDTMTNFFVPITNIVRAMTKKVESIDNSRLSMPN